MQQISDDVREKLNYELGALSVERHVRGKCTCKRCETLAEAPIPAYLIDKDMPTRHLLARVLINKSVFSSAMLPRGC